MRLLLDTHIFLWAVSGNKLLKPAARRFIEPIFLSYPVPKAVSPRFGLGAQANIRSTM